MYIYHVLINALSTHMIHINLNMVFYFPYFPYSTTRCCNADILRNTPGIAHMIANRQMPISLHVTVMPTFFQTLEALNAPQLQPDLSSFFIYTV